MYKELGKCNPAIPEELSKLLEMSAHNDWKHLAGELHYTQDDITSFKHKSSQPGNGTPCYIMLTEWSRRGGATIFALVNALKAKGRHDCIRKLEELLKGELKK